MSPATGGGVFGRGGGAGCPPEQRAGGRAGGGREPWRLEAMSGALPPSLPPQLPREQEAALLLLRLLRPAGAASPGAVGALRRPPSRRPLRRDGAGQPRGAAAAAAVRGRPQEAPGDRGQASPPRPPPASPQGAPAAAAAGGRGAGAAPPRGGLESLQGLPAGGGAVSLLPFCSCRITEEEEEEDGPVEGPPGNLPTLILSDTLKTGLKRDYNGGLTKKIIESM